MDFPLGKVPTRKNNANGLSGTLLNVNSKQVPQMAGLGKEIVMTMNCGHWLITALKGDITLLADVTIHHNPIYNC